MRNRTAGCALAALSAALVVAGEVRADWCVSGSSAAGSGTMCFSSQMECTSFATSRGPHVAVGACYPTGADAMPAPQSQAPSEPAEESPEVRDLRLMQEWNREDAERRDAEQREQREYARQSLEHLRSELPILTRFLWRISKRDEDVLCFPAPNYRLEPYPTLSKDPVDMEEYRLDHQRWEHEMEVCGARDRQKSQGQGPRSNAPEQAEPRKESASSPPVSRPPRPAGPLTADGRACSCAPPPIPVLGKTREDDAELERLKCLTSCFFDTQTGRAPLAADSTTPTPPAAMETTTKPK